uniref:peptidoglycan-binding domain-containing protein n=1 Tax=Streptomyces cellulosae TaxID=1968 RepID=UPI002ED19300
MKSVAISAAALAGLGLLGTVTAPSQPASADPVPADAGRADPADGKSRPPAEEVLQLGSHGSSVTWAQTDLNHHGYKVTIDSHFGPKTQAAVKAFQAAKGLTADGVVGPKTWAALKAKPTPKPTVPSTGTLTDAQARQLLQQAGITRRSTQGCTEQGEGCTSYEGIRARTVQGLIALKKASGCSFVVTGATEPGHESGPYSHGTGYKADINLDTCQDNYINAHSRFLKNRSNGDPVRIGTLPGGISAEYAKEADHWDITFR